MFSLVIDNQRYIESKYTPEEHKYTGWYWVPEEKAFMRWQDMIDFYQKTNQKVLVFLY